MAIETTLQARQKWLSPIYAVICLALALWGAYDYYVSIPNREAGVQRYNNASKTVNEIGQQAAAAETNPALKLTPAQEAAYAEAQATLANFKGEKPTPPEFYDRPVQLWVYMVGCGISVPWFVWIWWSSRRRHYRLDDEGTLHSPEGAVPPEDMADIDMSRWMSKSIATLKTTDGRSIVLDDYKYKSMHLIVGAIASKFYPEDWTEEARDRRKMAAEAAEAAAAAAPTTGVEDSTHVISADDSSGSSGRD